MAVAEMSICINGCDACSNYFQVRTKAHAIQQMFFGI